MSLRTLKAGKMKLFPDFRNVPISEFPFKYPVAYGQKNDYMFLKI